MAVKRNDPCPCGSGKKYKKCCLKKEKAQELNKLRDQRYQQKKELLQGEMFQFLIQYFGSTLINQLRHQMKERIQHSMDTSLLNNYFQVWLDFIYRDGEGRQGPEIYYKENHGKLSPEKKQMLQQWQTQPLRLLQCYEQQEEGLIVKDYYTKEQFYLTYNDQLRRVVPSNITFAFIEEDEHGYYIHGISRWVSQSYLPEVSQHINEWQEIHPDKTLSDILNDYNPELISIIEGRRQGNNNTSTHVPNTKETSLKDIDPHDVKTYEKLGFSEQAVHHFYAEDILEFFKIKTEGKSDATVQKYTSGLRILVSYLEEVEEQSWEACSIDIWDELIAFSYLDRVYDATVSQAKSLFATLNAFSRWVDRHYGTSHSVAVKAAIDKYQEDVLQAINILDQYVPYQTRRQQNELTESKSHSPKAVIGIFKVTSTNGVLKLQHIINKRSYPIFNEALQENMFIYAALLPTQQSRVWKITQLDRVYPKCAKAFIEKELGLSVEVL